MRREDAKASSRVAPQDIVPVPASLLSGRDFFIFNAADGKESVMFILNKRWRIAEKIHRFKIESKNKSKFINRKENKS